MTLTDADLAAIAARAEAATAGPWRHTGFGYDGRDGSTGESIDTDGFDGLGDSPVLLVVGYRDNTTADAAFIAHARTDIPLLLAEIARLRGELGDLTRCTCPDPNAYASWVMEYGEHRSDCPVDTWLR